MHIDSFIFINQSTAESTSSESYTLLNTARKNGAAAQWAEGSIETLGNQISASNACIVFPTEWMTSKCLALSKNHIKHFSKTAGFLVEDLLTTEIHATFFFYKLAEKAGNYEIRWIATQKHNLLKEIAIKLRCKHIIALPDIDIKLAKNNTHAIFMDNARLLLRDSNNGSFAYSTKLITEHNTNLAPLQSNPVTITYPSQNFDKSQIYQYKSQAHDFEKTHNLWQNNLPLASPSVLLTQRDIDFSGAIKLSTSQKPKLGNNFLYYLGCFVIFFSCLPSAVNLYLAQQNQAVASSIEQKNIARYQSLFPQEKRIINLKAQLLGKQMHDIPVIKKNSFIFYLSTLTTALKGLQLSGTQINNLKYDHPSSTLFLNINLASMDTIETLKEAIPSHLELKINSIQEMDELVVLQLAISPKPSTVN